MDDAMIGPARYERRERDAYQTPAWCVDVLCDHWEFPPGVIWEPAAGDGNVARELRTHGHKVFSTDIENGVDFLRGDKPSKYFNCEAIVTNPPYKQAEAFLRRALDFAPQVCFLLRHEWDCAKTRNDLFTDGKFAKKITLIKRPYWTESRKASPRHNYAWFCFDEQHQGPPTIEYGC